MELLVRFVLCLLESIVAFLHLQLFLGHCKVGPLHDLLSRVRSLNEARDVVRDDLLDLER